MNGAESLVHTLLRSGVTTCFVNPGTSEMHFVAALDRIPGMRCVLCLFEGVVTGAADGYARMAGKPAATLLHCGPGLANGLANLHNAKRASSAVINLVGDQAIYHRPLDPPLTADTEGWARGVSAWIRTARSPSAVGSDAAVAVQAAQTHPGQIATLVLPSDVCWDEGGIIAEPLAVPRPSEVLPQTIQQIARLLRSRERAILLLAGKALTAAALSDAHRIAATTGARIVAQQYNGRIERGRGRPAIDRVPYAIDQALAVFAGIRNVIFVGSSLPVAFFAYPGKPGILIPPDANVHVLARPEQDLPRALKMLAEELGAGETPPARAAARLEKPAGKITSEGVGRVLSMFLPDNAIVVDESVSFGRSFYPNTHDAAPHDWLQITGGAIGSGLPMAVGAAIAAPGRRVVSLEADGSAMYTIQALWTQARERLDITTVILKNKKYAILINELSNVGANPGRTALEMLDLGNPDLDWLSLARGMGVPAESADTLERFAELFEHANRQKGPFLIELIIE